jgi:hypothetical protein
MRNQADTLVFYGGEVKALGEGRVSGYCVRFGGKDLTGEFFTKDTYFGKHEGNGMDVRFHHGFPVDSTKAAQELARHHFKNAVEVTKDDIGLLATVVLDMANDYEKMLYELAEKKALGWSTGSAGHLVEIGEDGEIKEWPIIECSLTPTPAEPRNRVAPLKSLIADLAKGEEEAKGETPAEEPEVKSYLGDYCDRSAALSAIDSYLSAFRDRVLYPYITGESRYEESEDLTEEDLKAACGELGDKILQAALLCREEAEESEESKKALIAQFKSLWPETKAEATPEVTPTPADHDGPREDKSYTEELDAALEAVKSCIERGFDIDRKRKSENGRGLSPSRRPQLESLQGLLKSLLAEMPADWERTQKDLEMRMERRRAEVRKLTLP